MNSIDNFYNSNDNQTMYEHIAKWLEDYRTAENETQRAKAKALIVTRMLPIVKRIAGNIARRHYDPLDDLIQAGAIGLLKAIDSYSSVMNDTFRYYAASLIIGEMRHYIRDRLTTIRVPAYVQELARRIHCFIATLTPDELNYLTAEYVASALKVQKKDVERAMMSERRKAVISLDAGYAGDEHGLGYEEVIVPMDYKQKADIADAKLIIELVIARLPKKYRKLVNMYYYQDMDKREIAKKLNMTEMQVGRLLNKAFEMLHEMIADSQLSNSFLG